MTLKNDLCFIIQQIQQRKIKIKEEIKLLILDGKIESNIESLKWVLSHGCEQKLFVDVARSLVEQKKVAILG